MVLSAIINALKLTPINVFVVTNMKNNFVATFMLLAAGLIFNDVASVEAKPTKRQLLQQLQQIGMEATDAVYRCHGTFSNYKDPQQCIKAREVKDVAHNFCFRANRLPMACDIFSSISQAEMNAIRNDAQDNAMKALGGGDDRDYGMKALGD
jgi:hypothetical protein